MGRKFRKIEDVFLQQGESKDAPRMRYTTKDYEARKRIEREKALRAKRKQRQR